MKVYSKEKVDNLLANKIVEVTQEPVSPDPNTLYVLREEWDGLKFTISDGSIDIYYTASASLNIDIQYSLDEGNTWVNWSSGSSNSISLSSGDTVCIKNNTNTLSSQTSQVQFYRSGSGSGKISASGNIMSMVNYSTLSVYCFAYLFSGLSSSLIAAPDLPATTLAGGCYNNMFSGCSNLTTVPNLPATTLVSSCYSNMFSGCSSITTAPELFFETLDNSCCRNMFTGCTLLNNIKIHYTGNFSGLPAMTFYNWVYGVSATGDFYYNGSDTTRGTSAIPTGWTIHTF